MTKGLGRCLAVSLASVLVVCGGARAGTIELKARRIAETDILPSSTIDANRGDRIWVDIILSGWGPGELEIYQVALDSNTYTSGITGGIFNSVVACNVQLDCLIAYQDLTGTTGCVKGECSEGFIVTSRADYIFSGFQNIPACDTSSQDLRCGGVLFANFGPVDVGAAKYGGTFILDVTGNASGTFTIDVIDAQTFLADTNSNDIDFNLVPLTVTIPPLSCDFNTDCDDENECTTDTCVDNNCVFTAIVCSDENECTDDGCDPATGCFFEANVNSCNDGDFCTRQDTCADGECVGGSLLNCSNGDFCDGEETCSSELSDCVDGDDPCPGQSCNEETDQCEGGGDCTRAVVASVPPNCVIDARQTSDLDGSNPAGWDSVDIEFDGLADCITMGDMSLSSTGGSPPTITGVSAAGNVLTVLLSGRIEPGAWTCIAHDPSGGEVCLGYLPADANNDETAAAPDIISLVNHLNGILPAMELYQCDADRSDQCNGADIVRLIDLLNGAGPVFDTWVNIGIGACPSAP